MKILIATEPDDTHALAVKLALEAQEHSVKLLFTADQPTKQRNSVFIHSSYKWSSSDSCGNYKNKTQIEASYDVVWWRRARKPFVPKRIVHPEDYRFVARENESFFESLTDNMASKAWWINPKSMALRANSKLFQLKTALSCELMVPLTLCSNDPKEIRSFVSKYEQVGVIYKSLYPGIWFEEQKMKLTYTSKINQRHLPPDPLLQLTPGIYQKEIKKAYELRVVCFGEYIVAAKLDSQAHPKGQLDWRIIPSGEMKVEPYQLPPQVENKIRNFMQRMGLVFGSLDFIVTPENEIIFLEINEQGQFLWLESYNSQLKMLDIFIQFILQKSIHFRWDAKQLIHHIESYANKADAMMQENLHDHVNLNNETHYRSIA